MKPSVASIKEINALSQPKRIALFKEALDSGRSSFLTMGKIAFSLGTAPEAAVILREAGISAGSISNAAYGAKAFRCTTIKLKVHNGAGIVPFAEKFFDTLSFDQCVTLAKVTDKTCHSSHQITDHAVLQKIMNGKNWCEVLEYYAQYGKTPTQAQAAEAKRKKDAEKAMKEHQAAMKKLARSGSKAPAPAAYTAPAEGDDEEVSNTIKLQGRPTTKDLACTTADIMHELDNVEAMLGHLDYDEPQTMIVARLRALADQVEERESSEVVSKKTDKKKEKVAA